MFDSILDEVKDKFIRVISKNRPDYEYNLIEKYEIAENHDFSEYYGNIDWNKMSPVYKTNFSNYGNADLIQILSHSEL
ncbi:MAG: hypothetical protein ACI85I_000645 [Arenicella sp.]|jgi:hypothetical protein